MARRVEVMTSIGASIALVLGVIGAGSLIEGVDTAERALSNGLVWLQASTNGTGNASVSVVDGVLRREVKRVTLGAVVPGWSVVGGTRDGLVVDPGSGQVSRIDGRLLAAPQLISAGNGPDPRLVAIAGSRSTYVVRPALATVEVSGPLRRSVTVPELTAAVGDGADGIFVLGADLVGHVVDGEIGAWSEPVGIGDGQLVIAGGSLVVAARDGSAVRTVGIKSLEVGPERAGTGVAGAVTGTDGGWVVGNDGRSTIGGIRVADGASLRIEIPGATSMDAPVSSDGLVFVTGADGAGQTLVWVIDPEANRIVSSSVQPSSGALTVQQGQVWFVDGTGAAASVGADGSASPVSPVGNGDAVLGCTVHTEDGRDPVIGRPAVLQATRSDGGATQPIRWGFDEPLLSDGSESLVSRLSTPEVSWSSPGPKRVALQVAGLTTSCLVNVQLPDSSGEAENDPPPVVTPAPEVTAPPVVTPAPEVTAPPVVTPAPEATAPPVVTPAPEATAPPVPEVTSAPEVSAQAPETSATLPSDTVAPPTGNPGGTGGIPPFQVDAADPGLVSGPDLEVAPEPVVPPAPPLIVVVFSDGSTARSGDTVTKTSDYSLSVTITDPNGDFAFAAVDIHRNSCAAGSDICTSSNPGFAITAQWTSSASPCHNIPGVGESTTTYLIDARDDAGNRSTVRIGCAP